MSAFEIKELTKNNNEVKHFSDLLGNRIMIKTENDNFVGELEDYFFFNNRCWLKVRTLCDVRYLIQMEKVEYIKLID